MTCDQATFMLERRWDKALSPEEERALEEHLQECATCREEAGAISLMDAAFGRIPDCAPPRDIAAAVAQQIAEECPAEPRRAWFWGVLLMTAAVSACIWEWGVTVPTAVLASPYYASLHSVCATVVGALAAWMRPAVYVARSLAPAFPIILPFVLVVAAVEAMLLGRWMAYRSGAGHSAGRA